MFAVSVKSVTPGIAFTPTLRLLRLFQGFLPEEFQWCQSVEPVPEPGMIEEVVEEAVVESPSAPVIEPEPFVVLGLL